MEQRKTVEVTDEEHFTQHYMQQRYAVRDDERHENGVDVKTHVLGEDFHSRLLSWLHDEFSSGICNCFHASLYFRIVELSKKYIKDEVVLKIYMLETRETCRTSALGPVLWSFHCWRHKWKSNFQRCHNAR